MFGSYNSHKLFSKYMNVLAVKEGYHCHFTVILKFKILRNSIESQDNELIYKYYFSLGTNLCLKHVNAANLHCYMINQKAVISLGYVTI